eukprot:gnl/TRDRNA2_/TRDRNA2_62047_c0_seq1.p1 gnl/TRDRNA2_/TRDRNA2_62047_c0~~gnl/TRDRNA2_/TRDRNA2_62047_c0_seq1.p1  ORF type:complete len:529 (+),score=73.64 gnl/TRDRNA2_/TRDRNA2_62047_c0_seq1:188-1774(+)
MTSSLNEYLISWARKLVDIRASDAKTTSDSEVLKVFDDELAKQKAVANDEGVVGAVLAKLEDQGLVKLYTCIVRDAGNGYQDFWSASLPLLRLAYSANVALCKNPSAERTSSLREHVHSLATVQLNGSTFPPLAQRSQRVQADFRLWRERLSCEIVSIRAKLEACLNQIERLGEEPILKELQALKVAVANADVDIHGLADAVASCRVVAQNIGEAGAQQLSKAEEKLTQLMTRQLLHASATLDPKNLWVTWTRLFRLMQKCQQLHLNIPELVQIRERVHQLTLSDDLHIDVVKMPRLEECVVEHFQQLFDLARCEFMGLDRLIVERVVEVQHECTRAEYLLRREELVKDCDRNKCEQVRVKSQDLQWSRIMGKCLRPPEAKYNEFYLFHGTSPSAAQLITETDFKIKRSPDHGYTFGRGVYLAEYVTHAQFFSSYVCGGFGPGDGKRCAILVCRAFCGRVQDAGRWQHTARAHTRKAEFEKALDEGKHHSTMGWEWPRNPELREFVLADDDQVLPEFIVICKHEESAS